MCDCIQQVNEQLKQENTQLKEYFNLKPGVKKAIIATEKIDSKVKRGPVTIFTSFCPFCGEPYEKENG